ncbi:MAG: trigger factor [Actinomycetota bacterium]|nr:trigger factor [Actinomycetota bacterium]PLS75714.1 MAG: trigger factor [Actinomycetota bacterium]
MKAVVEPLEGNKVKLSVEVDEQEFERALDDAFRRIAHEVRIPGFRPGKAPRRLLEARIGAEEARTEALRGSLPDFYARALQETDVDPIAPPEIDITAGKERGPVAFDAVVEVRPQVSIAGYGGLRATIPSPLAAEEDVDRQIDKLREQSSELAPVRRPAQTGDHLSIDVKGERGGEPVPGMSADDYLYEVGSALLVPELDENLRGASVGDILSFSAKVDDEGPVTFRILVKEVKERILPEVTDEWAGEVSEFETVEELRADIRRRLSTAKRMQATLALRDEAIVALVELVDEEAPEPLVRPEMERRLQDLARRLEAQGAGLPEYLAASGSTEEQLVEELRAEAVRAVKADLGLRALAEAEGLEASEAEVEAEIERLAKRLGQKPALLRRELERKEMLPTVRSDLQKAKALEWLVEHIEIVDEEGHTVDRADLEGAENRA